jgi:hypothetical protein
MRIKFTVRLFGLAVGLAMVALGTAGLAQADTINGSPTGLASPAETITFDEILLPMNTTLTNQYASLGVTFSPNVFYSPQTGFGNVQGNDIGNFTFNGQGPTDPVTISFTGALSAAAFSMDGDFTPYLFEALLGGSVVDSFTASSVGVSNSDFYGFSNENFDAIRITRTGAGDGPFWVADNIQLSSSVRTVSEPATLLMLGLGLTTIGIMFRRRKVVA